MDYKPTTEQLLEKFEAGRAEVENSAGGLLTQEEIAENQAFYDEKIGFLRGQLAARSVKGMIQKAA